MLCTETYRGQTKIGCFLNLLTYGPISLSTKGNELTPQKLLNIEPFINSPLILPWLSLFPALSIGVLLQHLQVNQRTST